MSEQAKLNLAASDKGSYYQQKWSDDSASEFEATGVGSSRQKDYFYYYQKTEKVKRTRFLPSP